MPFLNQENKLVQPLFKFIYLIIYISPSKLKPKPDKVEDFSFYRKTKLTSGVYDWAYVHQGDDLFCMKNVNNLREVWYSVEYSLILQAKFAERAKCHVMRSVLTFKKRKDNSKERNLIDWHKEAECAVHESNVSQMFPNPDICC